MLPSSKLTTKSVSFRRTALASLLTVGALAAAACSSSTATNRDVGEPVSGGAITVGIGTSPDCFDPQVSPASQTSSIMRNVYDSLVYENSDGTFSPWLATAWTVSDDGLTYTFTLRDDVKFHDGTVFDAAAVKTNFDRIVAPSTASQFAGQLISPYQSTDVVDGRTAVVHLSSAYSPFLRAVSSTNLGFHSPRSITEHGDDLCQGGPAQVGTGPFVASSNSSGEGFSFTRNDDYQWAPTGVGHSGPARLNRVDFRILPESSIRLGALTSGEVDFIDQVAATDLAALQQNSAVDVNTKNPTGIPYTYFFNTSHAPFDDERARLAVQKGIDLPTLTQGIFQGKYAPAGSPLNPAVFSYDDALAKSWGYDAVGASVLLDELGYTQRDADGYRTSGGKRFTIGLIYDPTYQKPERITFDTAVQAALKDLGIELTIEPIGNGTYIDVRNSGAYDIIAFAWSGTDPDVLRTVYGSDQQFVDGGANASQIHDAELDRLLQLGLTTSDTAARSEYYRDAQELIIAKGYGLPAYVAPIVTASSARVHDLGFATEILPNFYTAWTSGS
ncbi:ABC transporter substrate-binding protein [Rhodococcus sp. UFZ-B548]|uniref:ABC transporter substrate-binding protein n=1 Tax=Rhodococcus sp. UFZ-B548 TaxID=2742212 RepID=UPI0015F70B1A|nr:ABC transporter substrate-binding protein [Rhodococcus sp. UFZ-B548]